MYFMKRCLVATTSGFFRYGSLSHGTFTGQINTTNVWKTCILLDEIKLNNDNAHLF